MDDREKSYKSINLDIEEQFDPVSLGLLQCDISKSADDVSGEIYLGIVLVSSWLMEY